MATVVRTFAGYGHGAAKTAEIFKKVRQIILNGGSRLWSSCPGRPAPVKWQAILCVKNHFFNLSKYEINQATSCGAIKAIKNQKGTDGLRSLL